MNRPPEPPPEGVLIESARRDAGLSVREAARRAGISEGWWRQVARGYQSLSGGNYGPVHHVPPDTIARMARAAGVDPDRLEGEGQRPDAAAILREPARQREPFPMPHHDPDWRPQPRPGVVTLEELDAAEPYRDAFRDRHQALAGDGHDVTGTEMFPDDDILAAAWNEGRKRGDPPGMTAWATAIYAVRTGGLFGRRTGTAGALTLA